MARWYPLESADADFLDSAPYIFRYQKRFAAPPEKVWESLASDTSVADWGPSVSEVTWLSPRPFGIGTSREVALGPARVRERFFRWDEGRGYSFAVYEGNVPIFRRFAEDYVVEPVGSDGKATLFSWTVAIEPKRAYAVPFKALSPVMKAGFGRLVSDGQRYFDKQT